MIVSMLRVGRLRPLEDRMGSLSRGWGASAVAAPAHTGRERSRLTDLLITGKGRRTVATEVGHAYVWAGIPEARWMRAMTFEQLVDAPQFVSELPTKSFGQLGLPRPSAVQRRRCGVSADTTAREPPRARLGFHG